MSFTAARESKDERRTCESCRTRKARFQHRGRVLADRHHTLCFECFRSERDRQRAQVADGSLLALIAPGAEISGQDGGAGATASISAAAPATDSAAAAATDPRGAVTRPFAGWDPNPSPLTSTQVAHRRTMLAHIQRIRAAADR
jgi:hypothetical protein